ncbi:MAG TPA: biopolymer transporter ExbD [Lacipirellulaceae bacterium]|nr:biopolymer transporter ExbD [Lacipirellulaceae bacterium]
MPLKTQADEAPTVNLTSLIDVVFLLIVFFMTASKFTDPARDIDLQLPEVADGQSLSVAPKARSVAVHADGRVSLDRQALSLDELQSRLAEAAAAAPQTSVVILGDAGCPFQYVAAAMAACKEAGIKALSVSVQVAAAESGPAAARR